jgi:hypothetical protein
MHLETLTFLIISGLLEIVWVILGYFRGSAAWT